MNGTEWQPSLLSCSKHLISIIPPSIGHASTFWHVDVQFDLDSQRTCVQLQSDTKRLVLIAIHGSSSRAGGLALMHSLSVVPLPTLLMLPRNCASLCPTSVVSIYRLLSASTERAGVCTVLRVTKELNHHHGQYHKNRRQTTLSSPPHRTDQIKMLYEKEV